MSIMIHCPFSGYSYTGLGPSATSGAHHRADSHVAADVVGGDVAALGDMVRGARVGAEAGAGGAGGREGVVRGIGACGRSGGGSVQQHGGGRGKDGRLWYMYPGAITARPRAWHACAGEIVEHGGADGIFRARSDGRQTPHLASEPPRAILGPRCRKGLLLPPDPIALPDAPRCACTPGSQRALARRDRTSMDWPCASAKATRGRRRVLHSSLHACLSPSRFGHEPARLHREPRP